MWSAYEGTQRMQIYNISSNMQWAVAFMWFILECHYQQPKQKLSTYTKSYYVITETSDWIICWQNRHRQHTNINGRWKLVLLCLFSRLLLKVNTVSHLYILWVQQIYLMKLSLPQYPGLRYWGWELQTTTARMNIGPSMYSRAKFCLSYIVIFPSEGTAWKRINSTEFHVISPP